MTTYNNFQWLSYLFCLKCLLKINVASPMTLRKEKEVLRYGRCPQFWPWEHWGNPYRTFTEFKMFYLSTLFVKETINHVLATICYCQTRLWVTVLSLQLLVWSQALKHITYICIFLKVLNALYYIPIIAIET